MDSSIRPCIPPTGFIIRNKKSLFEQQGTPTELLLHGTAESVQNWHHKIITLVQEMYLHSTHHRDHCSEPSDTNWQLAHPNHHEPQKPEGVLEEDVAPPTHEHA